MLHRRDHTAELDNVLLIRVSEGSRLEVSVLRVNPLPLELGRRELSTAEPREGGGTDRASDHIKPKGLVTCVAEVGGKAA